MMQNELSGPDVLEWLGVRYKTILSAAYTGGKISVVDSISPADSGSPRHVHQSVDVVFVVLTGRVEFWLNGQSSTKGAGETFFIPHGSEHAFRVVGGEPSRHLIIFTPGGFEGFFTEMAQSGLRIPEDMEQVDASAARHGLRFTGPPLGAE